MSGRKDDAMKRLLAWVADGAAAASRGVRWGVDAYCAFDGRLYERMQASQAVTVVSIVLVYACLMTVAALCWVMRQDAQGRLWITVGFLLGVLVLAFLFRRRLQEQRLERWRRTGRCLRCGYDLVATPDRCPECGTVPGVAGKE